MASMRTQAFNFSSVPLKQPQPPLVQILHVLHNCIRTPACSRMVPGRNLHKCHLHKFLHPFSAVIEKASLPYPSFHSPPFSSHKSQRYKNNKALYHNSFTSVLLSASLCATTPLDPLLTALLVHLLSPSVHSLLHLSFWLVPLFVHPFGPFVFSLLVHLLFPFVLHCWPVPLLPLSPLLPPFLLFPFGPPSCGPFICNHSFFNC